MTIRVLDIVDMQNGFMAKDGNLPVLDADQIIAPTNQFFKDIPGNAFEFAFVKFDTHFKDEYLKSPEGKQFPLHCEYGTRDWQLAVDVAPLLKKARTFYMGKNIFDMWGKRDGSILAQDLAFRDTKDENAYLNLFYLTRDAGLQNPLGRLPDFIDVQLKGHYRNEPVEIVVMGVAADFCVRDAIKGYLDRGFNVTVLEDLTKGIVRPMDQVVREDFKDALGAGKIRLVQADDFLDECRRPVPVKAAVKCEGKTIDGGYVHGA